MAQALVLAALLVVPYLLLSLPRRWDRLRFLSPVVVCYLLGLVVGNLGLLGPGAPRLDEDLRRLVLYTCGGAVLAAIPLLLVTLDVVGWLRLSGKTTLSCALCFGSVSAVCVSSALFFAPRIEHGWKLAGMLTGTFTGSAPNLAAVGLALQAPPELIVQLTAADLVVAGLYAGLLLTPAARVFAWVLPPFQRTDGESAPTPDEEVAARPSRAAFLAALALGVVVAGLGFGATFALPLGWSHLGNAAAIVTVTTVGIGLSFVPRVRANRACYPLGDYFLLVFILALGSLADLQQLARSSGWIVLWTTVSLVGSCALHVLLCRLLGIDRDTAAITQAAGILTPAFAAPLANALGNRELILSGISSALVGLAVGTYLGLAVSWVARALTT
jgi:uncharacterized membrane protein